MPLRASGKEFECSVRTTPARHLNSFYSGSHALSREGKCVLVLNLDTRTKCEPLCQFCVS
jgi:hypothetical protein